MREFILLALKANTSPRFNLSDLQSAGRMDLVCRTISNALFISNDLRRDTAIHVVMTGPNSPPKIVSFYGETLQGVEPNELAIAKCIQQALKVGLHLQLNEERDVAPGIKVAKKAFETLAKEKSSNQLIYLHPKGKDVRDFEFEENVVFIIGDFIGLPKKTESLLKNLGAEKMTLGPVKLFASHCPVIVHNELDRRNS